MCFLNEGENVLKLVLESRSQEMIYDFQMEFTQMIIDQSYTMHTRAYRTRVLNIC